MSADQLLRQSWLPPITPYPMPGRDHLPGNTADWTVEADRAVLLVHDMQEYFLRPFQVGEPPATELLRNAARLRRECAARGTPVVYTAQPGSMTPAQRGLLTDFWGPGMAVEPADRQVVQALSPAPGDPVLEKWRYSAFHRTDLLARMRGARRDQLVVCGVYAHLGVLMTTCEAFSHDIETFLVADAVADFSADHHRMALEYAARSCAVVVTTDGVLADLAVPS